jgi:phosphatidate cytidylyltransferase
MLYKLSNFQERALFGTLGSLLAVGSVVISHTFAWPFLCILLGMQAIAQKEFYMLCKNKNLNVYSTTAVGFSSLYFIFHFLSMHETAFCVYSEAVLFLFALVTFLLYFKKHEGAIANIAATFLGFFYVTLPLSLLLDINWKLSLATASFSFQNCSWLLFLIVATKMTDTCAYFCGKKYGKRQIAPSISPNKTREGLFGGLLGASFTGLAFWGAQSLFDFAITPQISCLETTLLGLFIGGAAVVGDLAESLLKRDAKVKDSNSLPGFGGVLDIVDSTLFTSPLLYLYLRAKLLV